MAEASPGKAGQGAGFVCTGAGDGKAQPGAAQRIRAAAAAAAAVQRSYEAHVLLLLDDSYYFRVCSQPSFAGRSPPPFRRFLWPLAAARAAALKIGGRLPARAGCAGPQLTRMSCCASSPFSSSSTLNGRPIPPTGDLAVPNVMRTAVHARAFKGELILFSFDFCGISEALSFVLSLRLASFEHFMPLSDGKETCDAMRAAARARDFPQDVPCWFSSWPRDHPGWAMWVSGAGCVSTARPTHMCVIEQLWATRYHVAGRLLARHHVNILHLDTDTAILADPYTMLKSAPLAVANLILLKETPVNGGMWYAQNTSAGGGAQWIISEVSRRTLAIISLPTKRKYQPPFDQAILGDALRSATEGGQPHWGAACGHPIVRKSALCNASTMSRAARLWPQELLLLPPTPAAAATLVGKDATKGSTAKSAWRTEARRETALYQSALVRLPSHTRIESVSLAPPWLFPNAWKAQRHGEFSRSPAAFPLAHLLGVRCRWCESSEDVDHGAKWEWQHLSGFWPAQSYILGPKFANASATAEAFREARSDCIRAAQEDGGLAGGGLQGGGLDVPLPERAERHCFFNGRARFLYARRRVLSLTRDSPDLRSAQLANDDGVLARTLIRQLVVLAALTGRMAVLPSFNCSAPWIRKASTSDGHLFVDDLRVVPVDLAKGAPLPLHAQRCAPCNVQFACREHVLSEAQHAAAVEARLVELRAELRANGEGGDEATRSASLVLPLAPRRRSTITPPTSSYAQKITLSSATTFLTATASSASSAVVDLRALWAQLGSPLPSPLASPLVSSHRADRRLGDAWEIRISSELADVEGDACSLDLELLSAHRPLAATIASQHCGVSEPRLRISAECPRNEAHLAREMRKWEERVLEPSPSRGSGVLTALDGGGSRGSGHRSCEGRPSPLLARLSARCFDMLCSDQSCAVHAQEACKERLLREVRDAHRTESAGSRTKESRQTFRQMMMTVRDRCRDWLEQLPAHASPQCDALTGRCVAPPDAFPDSVFWPSSACLGELQARDSCSPPAPESKRCGRCWRRAVGSATRGPIRC